MNDIDMILNKLLEYYDIDTMAELSNILEVSQPTISKWKTRNAIIPIKRRCKELGIYDEIFGVLNSTIINQGNNSRAAGRDYIKNSNDKKQEDMFDDITIGLIKKAIEKFGSEEEFQFQFMNFLRDK